MGKIGIMGGTFDPIHNGHLLLAQQAYREFELDEIWFMPSGTPPHKTNKKISDAASRCSMTQLAIEGHPYFKFSDFEAVREGNTYTAKTLTLLKETYPQHHFYFIIGADSLYQIESWYHPEQVLEAVTVLAAPREYTKAHTEFDKQIEYLTERYNARILKMHFVEVEVSSEELRNKISNGESVLAYLPLRVAEYIEKNKLYQEN